MAMVAAVVMLLVAAAFGCFGYVSFETAISNTYSYVEFGSTTNFGRATTQLDLMFAIPG
jgi:hypothetical protein